MRGTGFAWGSCGELVQGVLPDGTEFQVTCPIDRGTVIHVELEPAEATVTSGLMPKAARASVLALEAVDMPPQRIIATRRSCLPIGAGMGSSTADVVATARAIAAATRRPLSPDALADLAGTIEPSDGAMYEGIVAKARRGRAIRQWEWWPRFEVVVVRAPGEVRTDGVDFAPAIERGSEYAHLLTCLDEASKERDASAFARAATVSALFNQARLPKPMLANLPLGRALGVAVAHTGTTLGLLFPLGAPEARRVVAELRTEFGLPAVLARTT